MTWVMVWLRDRRWPAGERTGADHSVINSAARHARRRCRFQRFEVLIFIECDDRKTFANIA